MSRLFETEQLAWKVLQNHHLGLAPQRQCLAYGASILFSTVSTQSLHLPARLNGYVTAFRALQPHRLLPVSAMHAEDVLNEPLFFNRQITVPINASAGSTTQKPLMPQEHTILLAAGITKNSTRAGCPSASPAASPHSLPADRFFFFFFFLGYRGDVHPLTAKHRQRHRTNLICAGTTA